MTDGLNRASLSADQFRLNLRLVGDAFNTVSTPIVVLDDQQRIVLSNHACNRLLEHSSGNFQGQPLADLLAAIAPVRPSQPSRSDQEPSTSAGTAGTSRLVWFHYPLHGAGRTAPYTICTGIELLRDGGTQASGSGAMMQAIALRIHQSLNLQVILETAVSEVRALLEVERVAVYRLVVGEIAEFVVESVAPGCSSILHHSLQDPCFEQDYAESYRMGRVSAIEDVELPGNVIPCYAQLLRQAHIRALLIVPIVTNNQLWGLLCAHQCSAPRSWAAEEIDVMRQLATQMAIAIRQAELYQTIQQLNANLEIQIRERTEQLSQVLHYESIIRRIMDRVRDSLDEHQILQAAVEEVGTALAVERCDAGLFDPRYTMITIGYEYTRSYPSARGQSFPLTEWEELYRQILRGESLQLCCCTPDAVRHGGRRSALLICPIRDDQTVLGELRLFKPSDEGFDELDLRLVEQIANQCAIAIRQARLYEAAAAQVEALAHLNRLKDEFLSRVSHELRTPMSNIKMATQMLGLALNQELPLFLEMSKPPQERSRIARYFQVLHDECEREISLINDLLDLQRSDITPSSSPIESIALDLWLPQLVQPFRDRIRDHRQTLHLTVQDGLPLLFSDKEVLSRILRELLDNACKYTPDGDHIQIQADVDGTALRIRVTNTGVEIPPDQIRRIFDKFYRVPSADPWDRGGTGLGLALVSRLVKRLGGRISAESGHGSTCFTLELPLHDESRVRAIS